MKRIPILGPAASRALNGVRGRRFPGSRHYWEERYAAGGNSGAGSYDRLAHFKADVLNAFVSTSGARSVVEFGSGDGNQLALAKYPSYVGVDVSARAVTNCRKLFAEDHTKAFLTSEEYLGNKADLALSLDVIYHLVEDSVFDEYMKRLFDAADRFVIVYSSDSETLNERGTAPHVKHRKFTDWVAANRPGWRLVRIEPNRYPFDPADPDRTSHADFYFYEKDAA